ncbi:hypothetical protein ACFY35_03435 [Paractinoplanes globisporus]|uniref:Uncharacterized protein n=1 Tax=Paractinoplanes globisporus TaxID=113565 RepID=A0ABW6W582_9ACTN|nr:hypothetical protein [Actinoplanes globisporus]
MGPRTQKHPVGNRGEDVRDVEPLRARPELQPVQGENEGVQAGPALDRVSIEPFEILPDVATVGEGRLNGGLQRRQRIRQQRLDLQRHALADECAERWFGAHDLEQALLDIADAPFVRLRPEEIGEAVAEEVVR